MPNEPVMGKPAAEEIEVEEANKGGGGGGEVGERSPSPRDVRRYYCEFCGICRSKKSLIASHVLSHHQDEVGDASVDEEVAGKSPRRYTCEECGASFRKPAYLRQHMQGHSVENSKMREATCLILNGLVSGWGTSCEDPSREPLSRCAYSQRPFACPVDDCHHSYRRKDHLTRHVLQHQGKLFVCPVKDCNRQFFFQGNMQRHVKEFHDKESPRDVRSEKKYICPEIGCGKAFRFPSKLRTHQDSHVKLDYVEVICGEPGCMKHFTNEECLKAHIQSCHQHVQCPTCGTRQLRKNFKRHLRAHEGQGVTERIKCSFHGCLHTFSKKSNLNKHVKAVHLELRPFKCRISGCGLKFPYKHVRDNHEKCGDHTFVQGDFLEVDEQFRARPRGGRKRKCIMVESLLRKRIAASPDEVNVLQNGTHHLSQILGLDQL